MVKDKATLEEYKDLLNKIISEAEVIVGYNILGFDANFIENAGLSIPTRIIIFDVMLEFAPIYGE